MSDLLTRRLALLDNTVGHELLRHCRHGIEKESLRVDPDGRLALSPHPAALGSALTHAQITTDYSESLLEFITAAEEDPAQALDELDRIHRHALARLGTEMLWCQSMPCELPDEADIPIARYGSSHSGQLRHIYRKGLALRYGKAMQCIAGIHYNFSLPEALWPLLHREQADDTGAQDYQSARYFALIRNFRRYSWLLMYLFGASPALSASFLKGRAHALETFDADTLYLPWATSLRMSDLGYQNNAQAGLQPCYDSLPSYLDSLRRAVSTPYPPYVEIGTRRDGEWVQLNTNVLQIENEFYSSIRPKRVAAAGERPLQALGRRGVQYVEVRCLDIDPFLPLGIELATARFLDVFLLYCALEDSPAMIDGECSECTANFALTVKQGRRPGLQLQRQGKALALQAWGLELLDRLAPCAALLDAAQGGEAHRQALQAQRARLEDPGLTPSARVLQALREQGGGFLAFARRQSAAHAEYFRLRPLDAAGRQAFEDSAQASLLSQQQIEQQQQGSFADYLAAFMAGIGPQPR